MRVALVHRAFGAASAARHARFWRRQPASADGSIPNQKSRREENRQTPDKDRHRSKDAGAEAKCQTGCQPGLFCRQPKDSDGTVQHDQGDHDRDDKIRQWRIQESHEDRGDDDS